MSDPPHVKPPSFWLSFTIGVFGISSWITYNGLWVELPLLVTELPEGWTLPTYLVIVSQAANLGPLLYLGLQRLLSRRIECHRLERGAIYLILSVGVVSCLVLAFFWRYGIVGEHSVLFLTFAFLMATVDCCSSVTFLPYMASYAQAYMTALYIGEGCSGLLPGLLALIQGVGGEPICVNVTDNVSSESSLYPVYPAPRFSVGVFLCFLAAMVVASGVAFFLLEHWPDFQRHRSVGYVRQESPGEIRRLLYDGEQSTGSSHSSSTELLRANQDYGLTRRKELPSMSSTMLESSPRGAGRSLFWRLTSSSGSLVVVYVVVAWLNFLSNGFLSALQSYTTMPYSVFVYHLAATLTNVVNPLACVLTFVWQIRNFRVLLLLLLLEGALAGYLVYVAWRSPDPPLPDSFLGGLFVVLAWMGFTSITSFTKSSLAIALRHRGQRALQVYGAVTQLGSLLGAVTSFTLVNVMQMFHSKPAC